MTPESHERATRAAKGTLFYGHSVHGTGELAVDYLSFLNLHPTAGDAGRHLQSVMARASWNQVERDLFLLLDTEGWRDHLVACVALLQGRSSSMTIWNLWRALERGSWVSPQLAVTALLVDPEFTQRANWALQSSYLDGKSSGSLATLLVERLEPEDDVPNHVQSGLDRAERHPDQPGVITKKWKQAAMELFR